MNTIAPQNNATIAERIRALMAKFDMSRGEVARVLRTPGRTLDGWLDDGRIPPACMLPLLDVIEGSGQARRILNVRALRQPGKSRGRPFRRGNEWRFGDRRRKEALKQAAAIQARALGGIGN